jgi:hypothetical protein
MSALNVSVSSTFVTWNLLAHVTRFSVTIMLAVTLHPQVLLSEVDACSAGATTIDATLMENPATSASHAAGAGPSAAATTSQPQPTTMLQPALAQQQAWQQQVLGGAALDSEYCTFLGELPDLEWAPSSTARTDTAKGTDRTDTSSAPGTQAVGYETTATQQQAQLQQDQQQQQQAGHQDAMHAGSTADSSSGRSGWSVVTDVQQHLASLHSKVSGSFPGPAHGQAVGCAKSSCKALALLL